MSDEIKTARQDIYDAFYTNFMKFREMGFRVIEIRHLFAGVLSSKEEGHIQQLYDFWIDEIETQMEIAGIMDEDSEHEDSM